MEKIYRHYRLLVYVLFLSGAVKVQAQQNIDTIKHRNQADTAGSGRYVGKVMAELGLTEQQALSLHDVVNHSKAQISEVQQNRALSPNEKQQLIKAVLLQEERMRNSLLTLEQQQKLKAILVAKRQQKGRGQELVKQNQELLEHPAKGATFKSTRTIN